MDWTRDSIYSVQLNKIDSRKNYVKDNTQLISKITNQYKNGMSNNSFGKILAHMIRYKKMGRKSGYIREYNRLTMIEKEYYDELCLKYNLTKEKLEEYRKQSGDKCYYTNMRIIMLANKWNSAIMENGNLTIAQILLLKEFASEKEIKNFFEELISA